MVRCLQVEVVELEVAAKLLALQTLDEICVGATSSEGHRVK